MLYRLEENLPLAAESIIADFIPFATGAAGESALGVCVRLEAIAPLVEALEGINVAVQSIMPTAMATAQELARSVTQSPCLLVCAEPGVLKPQLNVIALQDGRPTHWALVPATAVDFKLQLGLLSTEFGSIPHIEAIDIEPKLADAMVEATAQMININPQTGDAAATALVGEVMRGRAKPWVEFRRDKLAIADPVRLHRRWIDFSLAATIALLLSLSLALWVRAHQYARAEQISNSEMVAAFQEHFPGWEIPVNVRAIVDAQYRRAAGANDGSRLARGSALITLHDVLVPMMAQDHFQIDRMAFHDKAFEISGRLQSFEQVDALSKIARGSGMIVSPAQTRKDADGSWTFSIQGSSSAELSSTERPPAD
jgi:hypothetical protein